MSSILPTSSFLSIAHPPVHTPAPGTPFTLHPSPAGIRVSGYQGITGSPRSLHPPVLPTPTPDSLEKGRGRDRYVKGAKGGRVEW